MKKSPINVILSLCLVLSAPLLLGSKCSEDSVELVDVTTTQAVNLASKISGKWVKDGVQAAYCGTDAYLKINYPDSSGVVNVEYFRIWMGGGMQKSGVGHVESLEEYQPDSSNPIYYYKWILYDETRTKKSDYLIEYRYVWFANKKGTSIMNNNLQKLKKE